MNTITDTPLLTKSEVIDKIKRRKIIALKNRLAEMDEVEVAELIDELDNKVYSLLLFRMLPKLKAVEVFSFLDLDTQRDIVAAVSESELNELIDTVFFDDIIDIIEEMPAEFVNKVLKGIPPEKRRFVNQFLNYPEDSAGSIMTIEYVQLRKEMTVAEALKFIREIGMKKETVYTCYVTNENEKLLGIVSLRELVTASPEAKVKDIMETDFVSAKTHDDQEVIANLFRKYDLLAIPVTDMENRLTGIITVDDVMDVMEIEATEDFQKMAAMAPSEKEYLDTNIFVLSKQRLLWLLVLMVSATITGTIMKQYSDTLESIIVLSMFIPMLMDTGGNAGSQSSTLIIRGMATGEIKLNDFLRVFTKEFGVSFICGTVLAGLNFARIMIFEDVGTLVAFTISITLIFTVMMAKLLGGMLPILAKKMRLDPAIMAGPLITTVVDALSLIIYFNVAQFVLKIN